MEELIDHRFVSVGYEVVSEGAGIGQEVYVRRAPIVAAELAVASEHQQDSQPAPASIETTAI